MSNKKMNKDEVKKAADEWAEIYYVGTGTALEGNVYVVYDRKRGVEIARFPFEPPHPKLIIGDTHRFWNGSSEDAYISKLTEIDDDDSDPYRYKTQSSSWYAHCEPFELIDPAEHAEMKKQNGKLHMEAADMRGQLKATTEDIQPLRVERDRLRREVRRLQSEIIDPEEHAKAKETEAVLAELLPLCEEVIEQHSRTVWPMSEPIERLEKLLK